MRRSKADEAAHGLHRSSDDPAVAAGLVWLLTMIVAMRDWSAPVLLSSGRTVELSIRAIAILGYLTALEERPVVLFDELGRMLGEKRRTTTPWKHLHECGLVWGRQHHSVGITPAGRQALDVATTALVGQLRIGGVCIQPVDGLVVAQALTALLAVIGEGAPAETPS